MDLSTRYLGLDLRTPLVASAGPLTGRIHSLKALEDAGVAAVVLPSLFEEQVIHDELMIDVANYEHVPKGPGIVLICDKAHYYFDVRDDRWGLRYRGRREARATGDEAVTRAFASALRAASTVS